MNTVMNAVMARVVRTLSPAPKHDHRTLSTCSDASGHYVGVHCPVCGPYSRNTDYITQAQAEATTASFAYYGITGANVWPHGEAQPILAA